MKNIILSLSFIVSISIHAQIIQTEASNSSGNNSMAFIDGSSSLGYNDFKGAGKGILFPSTDLTNIIATDVFDSGAVGTPANNPNYYDGLVVYNTGTGAVIGEMGSGSPDVSPGFYYYANPTRATWDGGTWTSMGGGGGAVTIADDTPVPSTLTTASGDVEQIIRLAGTANGTSTHINLGTTTLAANTVKQFRKAVIYDSTDKLVLESTGDYNSLTNVFVTVNGMTNVLLPAGDYSVELYYTAN